MESEHTRIVDLAAGTSSGVYKIRSVSVRQQRKGFYLDLVLFDRSGSIPAKFWNAHPNMLDHIGAGTYLKYSGHVELVGEDKIPQLIINDFVIAEESEFVLADFEAISDHDPVESVNALYAILQTIEDTSMRALVDAFIYDDDFIQLFLETPGSFRRHHAWKGGLVDHVLSVVTLADRLAEHYPRLDRDLLLVGAFIHDLGKIREFEWRSESKSSLEGRLLGHIPLGIEMLTAKAQELEDFPEERLLLLKHMIYSHHESARYGSPKAPMIPEALALQSIEALDSRLSTMFEGLDSPAAEILEKGSLHRGRSGARFAYKASFGPATESE